MSDFNIRADSVDVKELMGQIRARIRDKRGVDYTEQQVRELAEAKLERFLDPSAVRSDLLSHFRALQDSSQLKFGEALFDSPRPIVRFLRRLLRPVLKLFLNVNVLSTAVQQNQSETNQLYYELIHNLVVELTRSGIELKNIRMRLESLQSRLEFNERRVRALEGIVQYKPEAVSAGRADAGGGSTPASPNTEPQGGTDPITGGESVRTRRRRRRRGRRGPGQPVTAPGGAGPAMDAAAEDDSDDIGGNDVDAADVVGHSGEAAAPSAGSEPSLQPAPAPSARTEAAANGATSSEGSTESSGPGNPAQIERPDREEP
jgi:hypothetical protein